MQPPPLYEDQPMSWETRMLNLKAAALGTLIVYTGGLTQVAGQAVGQYLMGGNPVDVIIRCGGLFALTQLGIVLFFTQAELTERVRVKRGGAIDTELFNILDTIITSNTSSSEYDIFKQMLDALLKNTEKLKKIDVIDGLKQLGADDATINSMKTFLTNTSLSTDSIATLYKNSGVINNLEQAKMDVITFTSSSVTPSSATSSSMKVLPVANIKKPISTGGHRYYKKTHRRRKSRHN